MTQNEAKISVHQAAAVLTMAVCQNLPDDLPRGADGKLPDQTLSENLTAWQVHKIFYSGIVNAMKSADKTAWPDPPADAAGAPGPIGGAANGLVSTILQNLAPEVLNALVGKIPDLKVMLPAPASPAGELK